MTDQKETELDLLLGKASSFSPSSDFTQQVMSRIAQLPDQQSSIQSVIVNSRKRSWKHSIYGIAASLVGVLTIGAMLYNPTTQHDISTLAYEIDDAVLLDVASADLDQEDLTYAMVEISSTDGDQQLLAGSPALMY